MKKKPLLIIGTIVIVLAVVGLAIFLANRSGDKPDQSNNKNSNISDTVTVQGTYGCLKPSGDGPHTLECAAGLHQGDKQYGLRADGPQLAELPSSQDARIEITGTLEKAPANASYETAGTINVAKVRVVE